ncbi:hypothetical protein [Methylocystis sp. SB2]|uniref:hypothetical protein n=1 Tax=Methylocystis sp. (strain SB2) TaxID=743836 RepID=UPI0004A3872E|nr:hypothetical protein [Methylocystis sp. SB2]ULO24673.1 hypothetical protein LNB28_04560 [Methylocystis sp. SB2]
MGCDAYFRLYDIDDYDITLGRFQSGCFSESSDDHGVSVICVDCATAANGSVCRHARASYAAIGEPPIFWKFSFADLPSGARVEQKTVDGDDCHHNLHDIRRKDRERLVKKRPINDYIICTENGEEEATQEKLAELKLRMKK